MISFSFFLSFFLSWVANSQLNHWTHWVVGTQIIAKDPRDCPRLQTVWVMAFPLWVTTGTCPKVCGLACTPG